jgi:hypothetical protein
LERLGEQFVFRDISPVDGEHRVNKKTYPHKENNLSPHVALAEFVVQTATTGASPRCKVSTDYSFISMKELPLLL